MGNFSLGDIVSFTYGIAVSSAIVCDIECNSLCVLLPVNQRRENGHGGTEAAQEFAIAQRLISPSQRQYAFWHVSENAGRVKLKGSIFANETIESYTEGALLTGATLSFSKFE
jgi:hypothetical protein